jgi:hypothetical protein
LADFEGLAERRVEYVVLHKVSRTAEAAPRIDRPAQASLSPTIARYTERFGTPLLRGRGPDRLRREPADP